MFEDNWIYDFFGDKVRARTLGDMRKEVRESRENMMEALKEYEFDENFIKEYLESYVN